MIAFSVTTTTESLHSTLQELETSLSFCTISNLNPYSWTTTDLVNTVLHISFDTLNIPYEDLLIMTIYTSSFITSIKENNNKFSTLELENKLDFYKNKYESAFLLCKQALFNSEQKNIPIDGTNIRKTLTKITSSLSS